MNSYEAKRGFLTFITLTVTIIGMSYFANYVITQNTHSETQATSSSISYLPQSDLIFLIGVPILIIGIVITAIKRVKRRAKI